MPECCLHLTPYLHDKDSVCDSATISSTVFATKYLSSAQALYNCKPSKFLPPTKYPFKSLIQRTVSFVSLAWISFRAFAISLAPFVLIQAKPPQRPSGFSAGVLRSQPLAGILSKLPRYHLKVRRALPTCRAIEALPSVSFPPC